jgi:hypothetical protein
MSLALALAGACSSRGTQTAGNSVSVQLHPGDAGQSEAATLTESSDGTVTVSIGLDSSPRGQEGAGIYSAPPAWGPPWRSSGSHRT